MGRLEGKVAVVTGGGGSDLGQGISLELARAGARVVILDIDLAAGEAVLARIQAEGGSAKVLKTDITQGAQVRAAMDQAGHESGRLDILVNNAGTGSIRPLADNTEEEFDRLMAVNLRGMWLCTKYAIGWMQRAGGGSIINIGSVHSRATMPMFGLYSTSKAAVAGLSRAIAVQYGPDGIRANTVCPGLVDSPLTRKVIGELTPDVEEFMREYVRRNQSLSLVMQPEDIGRVVVFLASDDARAITGAEIPVDGGTWAHLWSRS